MGPGWNCEAARAFIRWLRPPCFGRRTAPNSTRSRASGPSATPHSPASRHLAPPLATYRGTSLIRRSPASFTQPHVFPHSSASFLFQRVGGCCANCLQGTPLVELQVIRRDVEVELWVIRRWVERGGCSEVGWRVWVQGYLAHKKQPPLGPYSWTMPRVLGGS